MDCIINFFYPSQFRLMILAPSHLNDRFGQVHILTSRHQLLEVSPARSRRYSSCLLQLRKIRENLLKTLEAFNVIQTKFHLWRQIASFVKFTNVLSRLYIINAQNSESTFDQLLTRGNFRPTFLFINNLVQFSYLKNRRLKLQQPRKIWAVKAMFAD